MFVIDDFIPKSLQQNIKDTLFAQNFPWFYLNNITDNSDKTMNRPGMFHAFHRGGVENSNHAKFISTIAYSGADANGYKVNKIIESRSFFQLPLNKEYVGNELDRLHVDTNEPHLVLLYYVCDADGDTIIVDKTADWSFPPERNLRAEDFQIKQRVKPKQGRAVLFDGRYYHTAEQPTAGPRCVINFNII